MYTIPKHLRAVFSKHASKSHLISFERDAVEMELFAELRGALEITADESLAEYVLHRLRVHRVVLQLLHHGYGVLKYIR